MSQIAKKIANSIDYSSEGTLLRQNVQALMEAFYGAATTDSMYQTFDGVNKTISVTDSRVTGSSIIILTVQGTPIGQVAVQSQSSGSFIISSTEVELSTTKVYYIILN